MLIFTLLSFQISALEFVDIKGEQRLAVSVRVDEVLKTIILTNPYFFSGIDSHVTNLRVKGTKWQARKLCRIFNKKKVVSYETEILPNSIPIPIKHARKRRIYQKQSDRSIYRVTCL
jgi:hypothetical protein